MPHLVLSLAEPRVLVLTVLCGVITAYLLTLRDKTRDLPFLLGSFFCWTIYFLLRLCSEAIYPEPQWLRIGQIGIALSGLALFVGFSYRFLGNPYPRESRIALGLAFLVVVGSTFVLSLQVLSEQRVTWSVGSGASLLLILWAESTFIRRWLSPSDRKAARPCLEFALVFLLSVLAVSLHFLRDVGFFPAGAVPLLSSLLYLSTLLGFALVYVNRSPRPTTFQVKIVGVSLFTILGCLAIMWTALEPTPSSYERTAVPASAQTISVTGRNPGEMLVEDYRLRSRLETQASVERCMYIIIGSTVFILVVFPLFFRASLIDPLASLLRGIDRLDEGHRGVQVPVIFNDEIGRLTANFNQMSQSLDSARQELVSYAQSLERKVTERTSELALKNEEYERLLLNILPGSIAERLKRSSERIADSCSATTIVFADIVGFTEMSAKIPASELVGTLSSLISEFDDLADQYGVEKIKTIGDAYMAVAGLPDPRADHAEAAMKFALAMNDAIAKYKTKSGQPLQLRIGMDSGPVIAGVIDTRKLAYDLWGDAVNTASRMQSHGRPGRIQVTEATYKLLRDRYDFESCGLMDIKGKGWMPTYLVAQERRRLWLRKACFIRL